MIIKPKCKIEDLTGYERILMLAIIREYSKMVCRHMGLEATEEGMISLIDKGLIKIVYFEDADKFGISIYNFETQSYKNLGEKDG